MGSGADQTPLVSEEERDSSPKSNSSYYVRMHSQGFGNFAETNTKSLYVIKILAHSINTVRQKHQSQKK